MCGLDTAIAQGLARDQGLDIDTLGPPERGRVQDGNARFCGGLGAHAGLFGTALDLWELGRRWLFPDIEPTLANFELAGGGSDSYGLGWAGKSTSPSAGNSLSDSSFGHTGFTGSSLWIDPENCLVLALATHRSSTQVALQPWRRQFHDLVVGNNSARKTVI